MPDIRHDDEGVAFIVHLLSSSIATIFSKTATAPLDRVKLILQTRDTALKKAKGSLVFATLRGIYKDQGLLSLWRGNTMNIAKNLPSQALIFSIQGFYLARLTSFRELEDMKSGEVLFFSSLAGGAAAATTIAITYPVYICQTVVSSHPTTLDKAKFSTMWGCSRVIRRDLGLKGFFAGFPPVATSVTINRSLYFGLYDFYKAQRHTENPFSKFLGGVISTIIAGQMAYPLETIGRRMAVNAVYGRPSTFREVMKKTAKDYGALGFFRGGFVNVLRSFGGAMILVVHDDLYRSIILRTV